MKILVFNGYYLPAKNYGGPTTSLANLVAYCGETASFYIVASNHDLGDSTVFSNISDDWNAVGHALVKYIPDEDANLNTYFGLITEVEPQIIWSVGMYSTITPPIIKYANSKKISVIMSPRGAINPKAVAIKAYKKIPYLLYLKISGVFKGVYFHVTSDDEETGAKRYLSIKSDHIFQIPNLPSMPKSEQRIKKNSQELKVVYISRINPTKNLLYAIQCVNKTKCKVEFDIYGSCEDKDYWQRCQKEINRKPDNVKINYFGPLSPDQIADVYSLHHCALLPTLTENYGHAIVEAMQNGCPVIIPKGTTPWDRIDHNAGSVIELSDPEKYAEVLEQYAAMDQNQYDMLRRRTASYIQKELNISKITDQYLTMIENVGGRTQK